MEKRPKMPQPAAAAPEGEKRRRGLLDKESMKGRRKQSNYEALSTASKEEECVSESMEAELSAFKANRAKAAYANTYRLEPHNKFRDYLVRDKTQAILMVASRWVWDAQRDTWVSAKYETETFIALALVMACYYE